MPEDSFFVSTLIEGGHWLIYAWYTEGDDAATIQFWNDAITYGIVTG